MRQLFDILPKEIFSPFASPNAPIYATVLLGLFEDAQRYSQPLSRELALRRVREVLIEQHAQLDELEQPDQEQQDEQTQLDQRAGAMLRYLTRCGWLKAETQADFAQHVILPSYAFRLLSTLHEIAADEPLPLQGLISAIHAMLRTALAEDSIHITVPEAHRQTRHLLTSLKELQHNIGEHIGSVLQEQAAREVLDTMFGSYRQQVVDRVYHQLKTSDHISRFRPEILRALEEIRTSNLDGPAAKLAQQQGLGSPAHAELHLRDQMTELEEHFRALDDLMEAIDARHSQFIESAVRTIARQLSANATISGQLHMLLTRLLETDVNPPPELVRLFQLTLIDSHSLAPPTKAATPFVAEVPQADPITEEELEELRAETRRRLDRAVGREAIRAWAAELLADRPSCNAADIPLISPDDLARLIYLRQYGRDGNLGYVVREPADPTWIEHDGFAFHDFVIERREGLSADTQPIR